MACTHACSLPVFSGQLSPEHSTIMSCSTFMTDGKCTARRCTAPPFPYPLHFTRLARAATRWPGPLSLRSVVSSDRDEAAREGSCCELRQWKNRLTPPSSILQPHLVKANTGQHIPSCHWKRGSDALASHANIVTCTNDDAKLPPLFTASLKEGGEV